MSGKPGQNGRRPISRNVERTTMDHWRERHKLSMREAAQVCGVGPTTMYHWCSGRTLPTLVMAFHVEEATDGEVLATSWLDTTVGRFEKQTYEAAAERSQAEFFERDRAVHAELQRRQAWEDGKRQRREGKPFQKIHLKTVVDGKVVGDEQLPAAGRRK